MPRVPELLLGGAGLGGALRLMRLGWAWLILLALRRRQRPAPERQQNQPGPTETHQAQSAPQTGSAEQKLRNPRHMTVRGLRDGSGRLRQGAERGVPQDHRDSGRRRLRKGVGHERQSTRGGSEPEGEAEYPLSNPRRNPCPLQGRARDQPDRGQGNDRRQSPDDLGGADHFDAFSFRSLRRASASSDESNSLPVKAEAGKSPLTSRTPRRSRLSAPPRTETLSCSGA